MRTRRRLRVSRPAVVNNDGCNLSQPPVKGLEAWRAKPEEIPEDLDRIVTDICNDIVFEELDHSPLRNVPVMHLPVGEVPCIGQLRCLEVKAGSHSHLALQRAQEDQGGFIGCCVDIPKAKVLPRGCVGCELLRFGKMPGDHVRAVLRGVASLRLINRRFAPTALAQEVHEWTDYEDENGGVNSVLEATEEVLELARRCGNLQRKSGMFNAADYATRSLPELLNDSLDVLDGLRFSGIKKGASDSLLAGAQRRAVLVSHAAVSVLKGGKLEEYICDPTSVLRRLQRLTKFLRTLEKVLGDLG